MDGKTLFLLLLLYSFSCDGYEFKVSRRIDSIEPISDELWSTVKVTGDCEKKINLSVKVPTTIFTEQPVADVSVFFANNPKNILQIQMKETIQGILYSTPYDEKANMEGEETSVIITESYYIVSGSFPGFWLPANVTKISANIQADSKLSYNYYGLQNYRISIKDVLNVEEYCNFKCSQLKNVNSP